MEEPTNRPKPSLDSSLRALEFYSGIGGMHYALNTTGQGHVVQAFDINQVANTVYLHNFPSFQVNTTSVEHLTAEWLDAQNASIFLMSPPCQPYTSIGNQKGNEDNRSRSLQHLLTMIKLMKNPPSYFLLENVPGFERSDSFELLVESLRSRDYQIQHFLLCSTQLGIPNKRMRYYCLAKRSPLKFATEELNDKLVNHFPIPQTDFPPQLKIGDFLQPNAEEQKELLVPAKYLKSKGYRYDIVKKDSETSTCFTKNYAKNFRGSGPLFLPSSSAAAQSHQDNFAYYDFDTLCSMNLRFFSPREIASLLGFPDSFTFPSTITTQQAYRLLGNSLSIGVVSRLLKYLLLNEEATHYTNEE